MKNDYPEISAKMQKTIDSITREFAAIRAGRANPNVLNKIYVDYYGTKTNVGEGIANISVPEPRLLVIQPYDPSMLKAIEKAILISDIGINPQNDGKVIRLAFPALTEERRKDIVKDVYKTANDGKVAIRNIRRDALEEYKAMKKKSEITEDDLKIAEKDIQELTDKFCKDIDTIAADKEKEVLSL